MPAAEDAVYTLMQIARLMTSADGFDLLFFNFLFQFFKGILG
jgi:hypothetical protein